MGAFEDDVRMTSAATLIREDRRARRDGESGRRKN
jgi:hypothetical protein